jgi:hypothetical protein
MRSACKQRSLAGVAFAAGVLGLAGAATASEPRFESAEPRHQALVVNAARACFDPRHAALVTNALRRGISIDASSVQAWCSQS